MIKNVERRLKIEVANDEDKKEDIEREASLYAKQYSQSNLDI